MLGAVLGVQPRQPLGARRLHLGERAARRVARGLGLREGERAVALLLLAQLEQPLQPELEHRQALRRVAAASMRVDSAPSAARVSA